MGGEILAGDDPTGPVAGDIGQVDSLLARHETDRRRSERTRSSGNRCARLRQRRGYRRVPGTVVTGAAAAAAAAPAARHRVRGPVADEHRDLFRGGNGVDVRGDCRAGIRGLYGDERPANLDRVARRCKELDHRASERARQLDNRLLGLHFDEDIVERDGVAGCDVPRDDLRLGQALAQVREQEAADVGHGSRHRSTSWRMRSASGRKWRSSLAGGYGVANPPTRRTGDSRE